MFKLDLDHARRPLLARNKLIRHTGLRRSPTLSTQELRAIVAEQLG